MVSGSCLALLSPVVASDKLFFWLFQHRTERLQPLVASLLSTMAGYTFSAPVIKEREVRLDGLFLPPAEELHDKPALILEAQMAAEPEFLLRLYIETALLLGHQQHQGKPVRHCRMLVICPSRHLNFGDPLPVAEFLREQAAATPLASDLEDVIAAILLSRFNGRSITDICATGGITLDDFRSSVAFKEIFVLGREEGREQGRQEGLQTGLEKGLQTGRQAEASSLTQRLLQRRFGALDSGLEAQIQSLNLSQLEELADALFDFQGADDLSHWLALAQER